MTTITIMRRRRIMMMIIIHSIFCGVTPSLPRHNIKRCMMLLGRSYMRRYARNMELSTATNGMSTPQKRRREC